MTLKPSLVEWKQSSTEYVENIRESLKPSLVEWKLPPLL